MTLLIDRERGATRPSRETFLQSPAASPVAGQCCVPDDHMHHQRASIFDAIGSKNLCCRDRTSARRANGHGGVLIRRSMSVGYRTARESDVPVCLESWSELHPPRSTARDLGPSPHLLQRYRSRTFSRAFKTARLIAPLPAGALLGLDVGCSGIIRPLPGVLRNSRLRVASWTKRRDLDLRQRSARLGG
jgi:hypothetical protein